MHPMTGGDGVLSEKETRKKIMSPWQDPFIREKMNKFLKGLELFPAS